MREIRGRRLSLLIDETEIKSRVREIAESVERDFEDAEDLVVVGLLKGAFVFTADLVREIKRHVKVDFMWVSSYGVGMESSGEVKIKKDLDLDIEGRSVLLVDDILDTGITLERVHQILLNRRPAVLRSCVLLDKKERRKVDYSADYVGFEVPDKFLVGYGLDWGDLGRNLPGIYAVEE